MAPLKLLRCSGQVARGIDLSITNGGWLRGSTAAERIKIRKYLLSITNGGWLRGSTAAISYRSAACSTLHHQRVMAPLKLRGWQQPHLGPRLSITNGGWLRGSLSKPGGARRARSPLHHQRVMAPLKRTRGAAPRPAGRGSPSPTGDGSVEAGAPSAPRLRRPRLSITNGGWLRGSTRTGAAYALATQLSITNGGWLRGSASLVMWRDEPGPLSITNGGWLRGSSGRPASSEPASPRLSITNGGWLRGSNASISARV